MLEMKLKQLLEENNKSVYWLAKQTGISQNSLIKIKHNKTRSINFDILEKILVALNCDLFDIIEYKKESTIKTN